MNNKLKAYFYFSRSERVGIYCLLCISVVILVFPDIYPLFVNQKEVDFLSFNNEVEAFYNQSHELEENGEMSNNNKMVLSNFDPNTVEKSTLIQFGIPEKVVQTLVNYRAKGGVFKKKEDLAKVYGLSKSDLNRLMPFLQFESKRSVNNEAITDKYKKELLDEAILPFVFDPNTINRDSLIGMGIKAKVANTLINFRSKGGVFRKPLDLAKIYGLDSATCDKLIPFVKIDSINLIQFKDKNKNKTKAEARVLIDVNFSTQEEWQKIRGIGPYYAKQIVNYRDELGGFHDLSQIIEVYGFPDSTFLKIKDQLKLTSLRGGLKINEANAAELNKHPYINVKQAKVIANYRRNHGPFKNSKDLEKVVVLKEEDIERIKPYLIFE